MWALDYRPKRFQDLVGQMHVVRVIANIMRRYYKGQGLPAGFLFAGTKGTGKTTSARVVAAMLNCTAEYIGQPGSVMEPCCQCESCKSVFRSNSLFVHEIDAASSGLVDDIRAIKEMAMLSHTGKVRVIILDEAHSLSKEAFEALLKQLEEPMPNVLYIFCTTEANKFPDTILSRLMQFNFKQIVPDMIAARLQHIAITEKVEVADVAVFQAIAVKSQGAMRDGIMMLEQLSNYRVPLRLDDFLEYYGLVGPEICNSLLDMAKKADIVGAKEIIAANFMKSIDIAYFLDNFMISITDLFNNRLVTSQQAIDLYKAAAEVKAKLRFMSAFIAANYLFALLLRVFSNQGIDVSEVVTTDKLQEMFN